MATKTFYSSGGLFTGCTTSQVNCSGRSETGIGARRAASSETPGAVASALWFNASESNVVAQVVRMQPAKAGWEGGTCSVTIEPTETNMNTSVTELYLCRRTSGCSGGGSLGSKTGFTQGMGATTPVTHDFTMDAASGAADTDELWLIIVGSNSSSMQQTAGSIKVTIATPIEEAGGDVEVGPAPARMNLHGPAPRAILTTILAPAAATMLLAGPAPAVTISEVTNVAPSSAVALLHGPQPLVQVSQNVYLAPAPAQIELHGPAPGVQLAHQTAPATGSMVLHGPAPLVTTGMLLRPASAVAILEGPAPLVSATAHVSVAPATGELVLVGPAPSVTGGGTIVLSPAAAQMVLHGPEPGVSLTAHVTLSPGSAELVLDGPVPLVTKTNLGLFNGLMISGD
jgi:hypothetical protein